MKINYGIMAVRMGSTKDLEIVHFSGFENKPEKADFDGFKEELRNDKEFGIGDEVDKLVVMEAPKEIVAHVKKMIKNDKEVTMRLDGEKR